MRASAYDTESSPDFVNVENGKNPENEGQGQRIRLLWESSDDVNFMLGYQHDEKVSSGHGYERSAIGDLDRTLTAVNGGTLIEVDPYDRKIQVSSRPTNTSDFDLWSLRAEWDIDDEWSFNSVSAYQEDDADQVKSDDGIGRDPSVGMNDILRTIGRTRNDSLTQEFRFIYEGDRLASVFGVFYASTNMDTTTDIKNKAGYIPNFGTVDMALLSVSDYKTTDRAIFNHNTYSFTDEVELTFGLRYSEVEKEGEFSMLSGAGAFENEQTVGFGLPVSQWTPSELSETWDAITGTLKISYWLNQDISMYAGYDRGFKAGGFNNEKDLEGSNGAVRQNSTDFDSEYANNWEIGIKGVGLDYRLRWNAAMFYQTYDDYQVEVQTATVGIEVQNAATAISQGFEADVMYLMNENWQFAGNMAYVDARYDDYDSASCVRPQYAREACPGGAPLDLSGKRLNGTSPWGANISTTYSSAQEGFEWFSRFEVAFKDDAIYGSDLDPDTHASSYTLLNGSIGIVSDDESWKATLWGKNLADQDYQTLFLRGRDATAKGLDFIVPAEEGLLVFLGEGRSFGVDLKYQF